MAADPLAAERPSGTKRAFSINDVAALGYWPTPSVIDRPRDEESMANCLAIRHARAGQNTVPLYLGEVAQMAGWSAPQAEERCQQSSGDSHEALSGQVRGANTSSSPAGTARRGALNPALSRWLMGYPVEWDCCGATAMQSCRSVQRHSSKRT